MGAASGVTPVSGSGADAVVAVVSVVEGEVPTEPERDPR